MQQKQACWNGGGFISEKRCDGCTHSQEDDYNEALKGLFTINKNAKNPRHPKT
jgi:hypothetical protein